MTGSERGPFNEALNALAVALDVDPPGEDREPHYWRELEPYPLPAVKAACQAIRGTWKANFYPKIAIFKEHADLWLADHRDREPGESSAERHCERCGDSGWEGFERPSTKYVTPVMLHYVVPCACRASNPVWQRSRTGVRRETTRRRWDG